MKPILYSKRGFYIRTTTVRVQLQQKRALDMSHKILGAKKN
jgi:hypothetical protein